MNKPEMPKSFECMLEYTPEKRVCYNCLNFEECREKAIQHLKEFSDYIDSLEVYYINRSIWC